MHIEISEKGAGLTLDIGILVFVLIPVKLAEIVGEAVLLITGIAGIIIADAQNKRKI